MIDNPVSSTRYCREKFKLVHPSLDEIALKVLTGLKYAPSSIFTEAAVEVDQGDAQPTFKVITGKNFTINTVGSFQEIEP